MYGYEYLEKFLNDEHFKYEEKEDILLYSYHGIKFVGWKNKGPYLQLTMAFFDVNESNFDKCLRVANKLNRDRFVVKTTVWENSVWCNYEFMPNEAFDQNNFIQIMDLLDRVSDEFIEEMKK